MARFDNAFALLGDEEGDDVTVLVEHIAKKVEVLSTQSKQDKELSAYSGQAEKVRDREGQGRGSGKGGYWGNDNFQNGYRRNYYQDSYGNGEGDVAGDGYRGRGRGGGYRGRGGGQGRGRGRGFNGEYGQQNVARSNYNEGGEYQAEQDHAGWYDEQRMHRNGGRYSSGERRSRGYRGQYYNDGVEQPNGEDLTGDYKYGDEEMAHRNGNRNYGYERRGYGGNRGRGRREFRGADNGEVKESGVGDDADKSNDGSEVLRNGCLNSIAEAAEKKLFAEGNEDGAEIIPGAKSQKLSEEEERIEKEKEEQRQRREEERKKEAMLMTLDQYEKMLSEKRKALEAQKAEERKVTVDKELEGMQLVKKKEDDSIVKLKSEEKLKKKDNLEKEKARKSAPADIAGFLKPASYRSSGREFGGGSDGGFRRQQFSSSRGGQTNDGGREQYIGDEGSSRGRYSSRGRGYDQGGSRGGNSYRGGRTSNAGREQSRGGRGGSTEVGSRGRNSAQGSRTSDDVGQKEAAAVAAFVNPYDQDFPVLGAKPSSVPAAASTTVKA